jgi:hypothetical protein
LAHHWVSTLAMMAMGQVPVVSVKKRGWGSMRAT